MKLREIEEKMTRHDSSTERENKSAGQIKRYCLQDLMNNSREIIIEHADEDYHLRITSKGKLLLTK